MTIDQINRILKKLLSEGSNNVKEKLSESEKKLAQAYEESLSRINQELAALYERFGDDATYSEMAKYKRLTNLEYSISVEIANIYGVSKKEVAALLAGVFKESYYNVQTAVNSAFDLNLSFSRMNRAAITKALDNPLDRIKWLGRLKANHEKAILQINSEIAQGLIQGKGYAKTARAIKGRVEGLVNNAYRIARTETHRVQTLGRLAGFEKSQKSIERLGYKPVKKLISVLDSRTRPQSRSMHRDVADKDGMFTYPNGVKAPGPGLTGVPKYDINDREVVILEIKKRY